MGARQANIAKKRICFNEFLDLGVGSDNEINEVFVEGFDVRFDVGDWANLSIDWGCCWCINYSLKV
jgi:hypothetical protein